MIGTVIQSNFHIHQWETGHNASFHGLLNSLFSWFNEFSRNGSAFNSINKFITNPTFKGLYSQPNMAVLTTTARLFNIFTFGLSLLGDGLFVSHLGTTDIRFYSKLTTHSVNKNI